MANNVFGYKKMYADKVNGESWSLTTDPNNDDRLDPNQDIVDNGDGTFRFKNDDNAELIILTSALFNADDIDDDHNDLDLDEGGRGYMMNVKDWRDVEFDFVIHVHDYTAKDGITIGVGGGRHNNPQPFCEGCAYKLRIYFTGDTEWIKEQWHNNKVSGHYNTANIINLKGQTIIGKFVRYNVKNNDGTTSVTMAFYINENGDKQTYNLASQITDIQGWGDSGQECGGKSDQILNWAFPMFIFGWDNADRIDWKDLVLREIQVTSPVPEDPTDPGQPTPPPEQPTGHVQKILSFRFPIASTLATSCDGILPQEPPQDPVPPNPPGDPPTAGVITIYWNDYWKVGE
jgi:hypothetical protein